MTSFLHTMVRITDPEKSRAFYEALGFSFSREMDIVRDGEREATNYFYSIGDQENVWSSRSTMTAAPTTWARAMATSRSVSGTWTRRSTS